MQSPVVSASNIPDTQGKDKLRGTMKMAAQNDYFVTCKYCSQTFVCDKCMTTGVKAVSLEAKLNKIFGIIKGQYMYPQFILIYQQHAH